MEDWTEDDWTEWVENTFEALDAKDVDAFVGQLTPGATVRFGNGDPVVGRVAIREAFEQFFAAISDSSHAFTAQLRVDDTLIIQALVTYTRHDGTTFVLPSATICELTEGQAERVQFYADVSPLFVRDKVPVLCRAGEGALA